MWLLDSDADEEAGSASIEKVTQLIADGGGEIARSEPWGRRTLAYPIENNKEASYFLAYFTLDSDTVPGVERALEADQTVIRHLLTRHERPFPKDSEMGSPDEGPPRGRRRGPR